MRRLIITLTLLAATTALAQSTSADMDAMSKKVAAMASASCPVGIAAHRQTSLATIWTSALEDKDKPAAEQNAMHSGVHVDLRAQQKSIQQVDLAVFYLPPGTRVLPVTGSQFAASPAAAPETSKNFSLVAGKTASLQLAGDLLLGPVASVSYISVMHITYADGTTWNAKSPHTCSREPSLLIPVQAK